MLIQTEREVMRCEVRDLARLQKLAGVFLGYERAEIAEFRKAVAQFSDRSADVLRRYAQMIDAGRARQRFLPRSGDPLSRTRQADHQSDPSPAADVREMLIQHILTEEIFSHSLRRWISTARTTWRRSSTRWKKLFHGG